MRKTLPLRLSLALAFLGGCAKKEAPAPRLDAFPVRVAPAQRRDVEETVLLVGTIKAKDEAVLYSRVPGKLQRNALKEGDPVQKGQPVCFVERDEVGVRFEPAPVPSTLSGVVARTYLDHGENVTVQTPVALVVDASEILARAEVPERFAGRLRLGLEARVRTASSGERVFHGSVVRASPVVDAATRTTLIEVRVQDGGAGLRPGMFGEVTLVLGRSPGALCVPAEALVDGSGPEVFVVQGGLARARRVEAGLRTERFCEIRKGLSAGERVVVFGLFGLKDGVPVEILPDEGR
jgi:multidrug efflux pump subunit AcrA (membrane-fusion protein)